MGNNRHGMAFGGIPAASFKNARELADEIGTHPETIAAVKSGQRGLSVDTARKVAARSGEHAPTLYIESQIASLSRKTATKSISKTGVLTSVEHIMRNISSKGFLPSEIQAAAKDPAFRTAAENLRKIALAALDLADKEGDRSMGPTAGSPNVEPVATKTARDAHGRRVPEGEPVRRDAYGRAER